MLNEFSKKFCDFFFFFLSRVYKGVLMAKIASRQKHLTYKRKQFQGLRVWIWCKIMTTTITLWLLCAMFWLATYFSYSSLYYFHVISLSRHSTPCASGVWHFLEALKASWRVQVHHKEEKYSTEWENKLIFLFY